MVVFLLFVGLIVLTFVGAYFMHSEQSIVEKAETSLFYHTLAKLTCSSYKGYYPNDKEVNAMREFVNHKSAYDEHPVGSYLKMCRELASILRTAGNFHNYRLNFKLGELGTGVAVMLLFVTVVALGVLFS